MIAGVYVGKSNTGSYDLISTGDYINPLSSTFRLKDLQKSIVNDQDLYLIINDISVNYVKIGITGAVSSIRCFLSWDGVTWASELTVNELTDALGTQVTKAFKIRIIVDDFLELFNLTGETSYKQYKLKLIYT